MRKRVNQSKNRFIQCKKGAINRSKRDFRQKQAEKNCDYEKKDLGY